MKEQNIMTLEDLLTKEQDSVLANIQIELGEAVVPAKGYTHSYIRKVNRMIDDGELRINAATYRKVYLPTFARAVQRELARRWTTGKRVLTPVEHLASYIKATQNVNMTVATDMAYRSHEALDGMVEEMKDDYLPL